MPQMGIQPEKKRRRKDHTGETSLSSDWLILYCLGKPFILLVVHRDQWIIQNYAASAALTLIETRLSLCMPSCIHKSQVIYIIFWPGGQLTFYGPFLIRICQQENLFALKSVVLSKVWCHSQKALNKLHSYIARTQQFITKKSTVIYNKEKIH